MPLHHPYITTTIEINGTPLGLDQRATSLGDRDQTTQHHTMLSAAADHTPGCTAQHSTLHLQYTSKHQRPGAYMQSSFITDLSCVEAEGKGS
jgi:hypothetical protein